MDRIVSGFHSAHYGNHPAGSGEMHILLNDLAALRQSEAEWKEREKARQDAEKEEKAD